MLHHLFFSIIIGDLIPRKDEVWCFYVTFLRLIDILLQNTLAPSDIDNMAELVNKNNEQYLSLFKTHLKPNSTLCEMYHKQIKRYVNQSYNRKNLPLSVCIKESLKFAARLRLFI